MTETDSAQVREDIEQYMSLRPCPDCGGARLRQEALAVKIDGANISEVTAFTVTQALDVVRRPGTYLPARRRSPGGS